MSFDSPAALSDPPHDAFEEEEVTHPNGQALPVELVFRQAGGDRRLEAARVQELRHSLRQASRLEESTLDESGVRVLPGASAAVSSTPAMPLVPELVVPLDEIAARFYRRGKEGAIDGLFVPTSERYSLDQLLHLTLSFPGGYRLDAPALVEWVGRLPGRDGDGSGVGLHLVGLGEEARREIAASVVLSGAVVPFA